mmetsp:Transcript_49547/g.149333  ORF Transcript_49547/g.149333 Transcript_49547/m.149333 type:complete len:100 (+) Transcript_49547:953-1252(+)
MCSHTPCAHRAVSLPLVSHDYLLDLIRHTVWALLRAMSIGSVSLPLASITHAAASPVVFTHAASSPAVYAASCFPFATVLSGPGGISRFGIPATESKPA